MSDDRPGFPGGDADGHLRTIPACAALGLLQTGQAGATVATSIAGTLPAANDGNGRIDRGAALVLADQATAGGVFASLDRPSPMMTLDLRVDWFAALPADTLACAIDDVTREGDLALVRGRLVAADDTPIGAATARYLLGAMPGGGAFEDAPAGIMPVAANATFEHWLGAVANGDAMTLHPRPDHVGGRTLPAFHGGVIGALIERAGLLVADPSLRPLDIEIRYLAPARADRPLHARGVVRRAGRRATTIDVDAWQDDPARPVAIGRMLLIADPPGPPHFTAL